MEYEGPPITTEDKVYFIGSVSTLEGSIIFSDGFALKIWWQGTTSVIAGNVYNAGYVDGVGTDARLTYITSAIELYDSEWLLADMYNHCLRVLNLLDQTVRHFLGDCPIRHNPPTARPIGLSYPCGIIADPFNEYKIYLSQEMAIWNIDTDLFEILPVFEYVHELSHMYNYSQMNWYGTSLIVTYESLILRLDIPRGRNYPYEVYYTFSKKLEWSSVSAVPSYRNLDLPEYRGLASINIEGILIVVDKLYSAVRLLNLKTNEVLTVCQANSDNDNHHCPINAPTSVFYDFSTSVLYVGHDSGLITLKGMTKVKPAISG